MSGQFTYALATPDDDADLRRLLANTPMPGSLTITFQREPTYFYGAGVHGKRVQVLTARNGATGALVGMGVRCGSEYYVNGEPAWLGYVGELRVSPAFQRQGVLFGGLPFFLQLHAAQPYPAYLAAIASDNGRAMERFVGGGRRGLPPLRQVAHIVTRAIILRRARRPPPLPAGVVRGRAADVPRLVEALQRLGRQRQLFPVYQTADFAADSRRTPGLDPDDFLYVEQRGRIVALAAMWDQTPFKYWVVAGYHGALRLLRPLYNGVAPLLRIHPLARRGGPIRTGFASFLAVDNQDPRFFAPLLSGLIALARARGLAYLMVGLAENDPLLPVAGRYPHITYHSDLYLVGWPGEEDVAARLDGRVASLEIAAL